MIVLYIVLGIVALLVIYLLTTYNSLVRLRNRVREAFSTMDVYLKKRWDLIPNLVETVKGYAKHEKETLSEIVELRNLSYDNLDPNQKVEANEKLNSGLTKLFAIAEAYPDLKANENFKELTAQLSKIEDEIANSRKYYNGTVRIYNDRIMVFPTNLVAGMFGFKEMKMFEAAEEERKNVKVEF